MNPWKQFFMLGVCAGLAVLCGCGYIADKDRIVIAKINDEYITRGDLFRIIREMPDEERPSIKNKGDLLRVLDNYIDERIKTPLGDQVAQELEAQGKQLVTRDMAKTRYFAKRQQQDEKYQGEKVDYAAIYDLKNPEALDMTQIELDAIKTELDLGIDKEFDLLKGEAAIAYRATQAMQDGSVKIEDAEYEQEYRLRKEELKKLEWIRFKAIRIPADVPGAETEAAAIRERLDRGELLDSLMDEYRAKNPIFVIESEIENNPALERFRGFWLTASGSKRGDILGPVFLPEYQAMAEVQGKTTVRNMPAAYLVLEILEYRPESTLSLEDAKPIIAPAIAVTKMMKLLRQQNGVEIYQDKMPEPSLTGAEISPAA